MYLETILVLGKTKQCVRAIDIVEEIGYSKPSVSRALAKLKAGNCIRVDDNGYITLTETGRKIAETIYERHVVLSEMLIKLGVERETALADACKIEHDISAESFAAIKRHFVAAAGGST